ncbi:transposase [Bacillus sp. NPDC094106]|uniref:transposase n=1 Tax=Bacillus sp. NPDC094106 TaxID=3363949 RepID=UPI003826E57D
MKVQEVLLDDSKKRYLLLDEGGMSVVPVMKYLDTTEKSSNTLKTYCYAFK